VTVDYDSVGVDVPEDIKRVEKILTTDKHGLNSGEYGKNSL
jgi:CMP-2-keto-3-deoxyoctulosonic acid synthetase